MENIRGTASKLLAGRRIVLAVSGSIAAVKSVELARELIRHGADVHGVMSSAAMGIIHPDALEFGTGNPVITQLSGNVEHVQLLGDVPGKADLLLVAPATANTITKMALGIDDTPITTCAIVAFGTKTPVVVAPAMHEAMLDHPIVGQHAQTLIDRLGVTWVEPLLEEKKAKLADVDAIVDAVIRRLHATSPLAGRHMLVVGGATGEPVDSVRILTNRSSGKTATILAQALYRRGANVTLWYGRGTADVPACVESNTIRFETHAQLAALADAADGFDDIWMPAAINDYSPEAHAGKIASEQANVSIQLRPLDKIIERLHKSIPDARLIAFKAESSAETLVSRARERLDRYGADWIVANTDASFGAVRTQATLVGRDGAEHTFEGDKSDVFGRILDVVYPGAA